MPFSRRIRNCSGSAKEGLAGFLILMARLILDLCYKVPLLSCACHSWSVFCTGYDILRVSAVEKREPIKGIGIDARNAVGRTREWNGFGGVRRVVLEKA